MERRFRPRGDRNAAQIYGRSPRSPHRHRRGLSNRDAPLHREQSRTCEQVHEDHRLPALSSIRALRNLPLHGHRTAVSAADRFEQKLSPWIESQRNDPQWGNARSMRTLLEKVREAHALRTSLDPEANLAEFHLADIEAAIRDS